MNDPVKLTEITDEMIGTVEHAGKESVGISLKKTPAQKKCE